MRTALNLVVLAMLGFWTIFCFYVSIENLGNQGNVSTIFMVIGTVHMIAVATGCILVIIDMIKLLKKEVAN